MNPYSKMPARARFVSTLGGCVALAVPLLLNAAPAAAAPTACPQTHGSLDARLANLADQGVAPFVQYVHRTRTIYQFDIVEALGRVAAYRQKTAACSSLFDE